MGRNLKEEEKIMKLSQELCMPVTEVARDLLGEGIEYPEKGLVFPLGIKRAKSRREKVAAQSLLTRELTRKLISQNREPGKPRSARFFLQEIGGGTLKKGEWIGITKTLDGKGYFYWGTRGSGKIEDR